MNAIALIILSKISIHAPREGSDNALPFRAYALIIFQSTLPARGATFPIVAHRKNHGISIHAPREGSDGESCGLHRRGGLISIHAPREGSDSIC